MLGEGPVGKMPLPGSPGQGLSPLLRTCGPCLPCGILHSEGNRHFWLRHHPGPPLAHTWTVRPAPRPSPSSGPKCAALHLNGNSRGGAPPGPLPGAPCPGRHPGGPSRTGTGGAGREDGEGHGGHQLLCAYAGRATKSNLQSPQHIYPRERIFCSWKQLG